MQFVKKKLSAGLQVHKILFKQHLITRKLTPKFNFKKNIFFLTNQKTKTRPLRIVLQHTMIPS